MATICRGKTHAITSQMAIGRRARSKVRVQVVGSTSMGLVEALKAWGVELEAVVVDTPDKFKDIRRLLSITPTTTLQAARRAHRGIVSQVTSGKQVEIAHGMTSHHPY